MPESSSLPDPEVIRRTAAEVIQRPDYQLDKVGGDSSGLVEMFLKLLWWMLTPFRWLFEALEWLPDPVRWLVVIGLVVIVVALITHIVYTIIVAIRGPQRRRSYAVDAAPIPLDPAILEKQALEAAARGEFIDAVRLLFRACLLYLERYEKRAFRRGTTNRDLLRRYNGTPVHPPMSRFVETIDLKWYGGGDCLQADYDACQVAYRHIGTVIRERPDAHSA